MAERSKVVRIDAKLADELHDRAQSRGFTLRQALELVVASWLRDDGELVSPSSDKRRHEPLALPAQVVENLEAHLQAQIDQLASMVLDLQRTRP